MRRADGVVQTDVWRSHILALLEHRLAALARHGRRPSGGVERLAYTPAWSAAAAELASWLRADGFAVHRDAVGNTYGVLAGSDAGPSIVTGSHLDTVLDGGRFDGALGVVGASIALKLLHETYGRPRRTLELLATCDEEASRFPSNFWGARAVAGGIFPDEADVLHDRDGVSLADAMRAVGLDPLAIPSARRADIGAFVELHIEQGHILEQSGTPVGVVEAITGLRQLEYTLIGRADHAGTTSMAARRDPVVPFGRVILELQRLALELGEPAVATIGRIAASPGNANVVPAQVRFTVDARYHLERERQAYNNRLEVAVRAIAAEADVGVESTTLLDQPATPLSPAVVDAIDDASSALAIPHRRLVSGAGHDTQVLARAGVQAGMVFVASRNGRSHVPDEFSALDDCAAGTAVLTETLRRLAYE